MPGSSSRIIAFNSSTMSVMLKEALGAPLLAKAKAKLADMVTFHSEFVLLWLNIFQDDMETDDPPITPPQQGNPWPEIPLAIRPVRKLPQVPKMTPATVRLQGHQITVSVFQLEFLLHSPTSRLYPLPKLRRLFPRMNSVRFLIPSANSCQTRMSKRKRRRAFGSDPPSSVHTSLTPWGGFSVQTWMVLLYTSECENLVL